MIPDPCKSLDPFVDDLIDLIVWLPSSSFDAMELCSSAEFCAWKPPDVCIKWFAPVFAVAFVRYNEATVFETFGVN